jgi:flagellar hook-associated protein 1 FlgK
MAGLNIALEAGRRALFSQQTAVNVTGHNIANVNTPGFSRQRAVLAPANSIDFPSGWVGTGVTVDAIQRVYDRFLAAQITTQTQAKGKAEAENEILDQVQSIFNETSGPGLNQALSDFWNAWKTVSTNPTGAAERSGLVAKTATLTQFIRDAESQFNAVQTRINDTIRATVDQVNLLTREIANLNQIIQQAEGGGQQPANDLRDKQQLLVDQLAEVLPVQTFQQVDGQLGLQLPGGKPLVNGTSSWELAAAQSGTTVRVQWLDSTKTPVDITDQLPQSKLGGFIEARDSLVANYRGKLDTLAAGLINAVNSLHSNGIGLAPFTSLTGTNAVSDPSAPLASSAAGLPFGSNIVNGSFQVFAYDSSGAVSGSGTVTIDPATMSLADVATALSAIPGVSGAIDPTKGILTISGSGGHTFALGADTSNVLAALGLNTFFTGSGAHDIAVNPLVQGDPNHLAAAQLESDGTYAAGDNRNALAISAVQTTSLNLAGASCTIDDFYGALLGQIGADAQQAEQGVTQQDAVLEQLTNRRDAISGVSIDEEMTNLIKFQQAYTAAAKLITQVDDMMRTVIEMV